ncbi:unnamed protein product [Paramecium pentaurelia]|uniref:Uncharacterized protein n=1 Tax=Paramecium pentaurelia TaxID=43138 RepID=A0A8S1W8S2_9CILI|nr:unnamed protein product [Paramecium pentaurelia]
MGGYRQKWERYSKLKKKYRVQSKSNYSSFKVEQEKIQKLTFCPITYILQIDNKNCLIKSQIQHLNIKRLAIQKPYMKKIVLLTCQIGTALKTLFNQNHYIHQKPTIEDLLLYVKEQQNGRIFPLINEFSQFIYSSIVVKQFFKSQYTWIGILGYYQYNQSTFILIRKYCSYSRFLGCNRGLTQRRPQLATEVSKGKDNLFSLLQIIVDYQLSSFENLDKFQEQGRITKTQGLQQSLNSSLHFRKL